MLARWLSVQPAPAQPHPVDSGDLLGSFSGVVVDDSGKPLPDATVLYDRMSDIHRQASGRLEFLGPQIRSSVSTDSSGRFRADKLPPGRYSLCAMGKQAAHLMSCQWDGQYVFAEVRRKEETPNLKLAVRTGTLLTVRIQDVNGRIAQEGRQMIGVMLPNGAYYKARFVSRTGNDVIYSLAVPKSAAMSLFVGSALNLADALGQSVPINRPSVPITTSTAAEHVVALVAR